MAILFLVLPPTALAANSRTFTINADTVTATNGGQLVEARGRVVITDGRLRARADRVLYNRKTQRIQLTGNVTVTTPQAELKAGEATAQLTRGTLDTFTASGGVTARFAERTLRADKATYQAKTEVLTATGRPRIQSREGFIEGDRLEVQSAAQTAMFRGNVVGVFEETRVTSAVATLLAKENKAVFQEKVAVSRPGRTMAAQTVTYYYKDKRLVAEGETTIKIQETPP